MLFTNALQRAPSYLAHTTDSKKQNSHPGSLAYLRHLRNVFPVVLPHGHNLPFKDACETLNIKHNPW